VSTPAGAPIVITAPSSTVTASLTTTDAGPAHSQHSAAASLDAHDTHLHSSHTSSVAMGAGHLQSSNITTAAVTTGGTNTKANLLDRGSAHAVMTDRLHASDSDSFHGNAGDSVTVDARLVESSFLRNEHQRHTTERALDARSTAASAVAGIIDGFKPQRRESVQCRCTAPHCTAPPLQQLQVGASFPERGRVLHLLMYQQLQPQQQQQQQQCHHFLLWN